mgnify:CR=1 FL=1
MKSLNQAAIAIAVATLASVAGAQSTDKLTGYLNVLDSDATVREAHAVNPVDSMMKYGLNADEQKALLSQDKASVAKLLGIDDSELHMIQAHNANNVYSF